MPKKQTKEDNTIGGYKPKTPLGRKLLRLRREYAAKGGKFLNREELDEEIRNRKLGNCFASEGEPVKKKKGAKPKAGKKKNIKSCCNCGSTDVGAWRVAEGVNKGWWHYECNNCHWCSPQRENRQAAKKAWEADIKKSVSEADQLELRYMERCKTVAKYLGLQGTIGSSWEAGFHCGNTDVPHTAVVAIENLLMKLSRAEDVCSLLDEYTKQAPSSMEAKTLWLRVLSALSKLESTKVEERPVAGKSRAVHKCPECGNTEANGEVHAGCDWVYGRGGWRQLGVYSG